MGLFHCVGSGCTEVRYQPYKKVGGIKYRYSNEDWIIIDGDNWTINNSGIECQSRQIFSIVYGHVVIKESGNRTMFDGLASLSGAGLGEQFQGFILNRTEILTEIASVNGKIYTVSTPLNQFFTPDSTTYFESVNLERIDYYFAYLREDGSIKSSFKLNFENGIPSWLEDSCAEKCRFTVYKDKQIIYQESRIDCPEVEKIDGECELGDRTKVIQIEKLPFLERVDVVPWAYQNLGANVNRRDIPDNCLNIYKPTTATIPPAPGPIPTPSNSAIDRDFSYGFVGQICSDPGCPPPEYEVICNCSGKECPNGTCPVECGNVVCCYDPNTGISVDSIKIENYSGGHLS